MFKDITTILIDQYHFFLLLLLEHIYISFIAITIATIIGLLTGILISQYILLRTPILSSINILYTIPSIALLGFLLPFSGVGNTTAIIALILYALLPMVRSTYVGITNINPTIIESATGMGSNNFQLLTKIKLPIALPIIMSGFRNMVVMTISVTGIASFIGAGGLGVAIYQGIATNNAPMTLVGSILIAILALLADLFLGFVERLIEKKHYYILRVISIIISIFILILLILTFVKEKVDISIATKIGTEQFIMGEILKLLIEDRTGLNVDLYKSITTKHAHLGMTNGDFDIYPEYTGTAWLFVLKNDYIPDKDKLIDILKNEYLEKYNLQWIGFYGFNNQYGLAIHKDIAEANNITTYSDLAKISSTLSLGAGYDFFEREDGYDGLVSLYNLKFDDIIDMDFGLKYLALNSKDSDVITIFTTDGLLAVSDAKVLIDDKSYFPNYYAGTIIRTETLKEYPELKDILMLLDGLIDDTTMQSLNYQVESLKRIDKDVAYEFLLEKGLIKE